MAMKVEELQVLISANADQFKTELQSINKQLGSLTDITSSTGKAIGGSLFGSIISGNVVSQMFLGTLSKLGDGLFNITNQIIDNGSAYNRLKIATNTVARNMGLTREETDGLRQALYATNTYGSKAEEVLKSLAMSGLMPLAKEMSAFDARTGKTVTGVNALIIAMKDLSAAAGVDSATGIEKLTKFIQSGILPEGVVEFGDMTQAYKAFAQTHGKASADALSVTERAYVRMIEVMKKGRDAQGAYANTMQTSAKAMQSVGNIITSIFEMVGASLEPIFFPLANALFQFFDAVRSIIIDNEAAIRAWATNIAGYIVAVIRVIGKLLSMLPNVGKYFNGLANFTLKTSVAATDAGGAMEDYAGGVDEAANSAKKLKKELAGLAGFDEMNVLSKPQDTAGAGTVGNGGMSLGTMGGGATDWGDMVNSSIPDINKAADELFAKWSKGFTDITDKWNNFVTPIKEAYNTYLKPIFDWIVDKLGIGLSWAIGFVKQQWEDLVKTIKDNWATLQPIFTAIGVAIAIMIIAPLVIVTAAIIAIIAIIGVLIWMWNMFFKAISWIMEQLFNFFYNFFLWLFKLRDAAVELWDKFTNKVDETKNKVMDFVDKVKEKFEQLKGAVNGALSNVADGFKQKINDMIWRLNQLIDMLNQVKFDIAGKSYGINISHVPYLASGGVITSPTLAMIGENGDEAVMPLEKNTGWIDKLAAKINGSGGSTAKQPINVYIGNEKVYEGFVDYHNDRSELSGNNILVL